MKEWTKKGDKKFAENVKFPASIMFWGGIIGNQKTQLLECDNRMNAEGYVKLLDDNGIVEFLRQYDENAVFQQDGAPCHTARSTRRWFATKNVR